MAERIVQIARDAEPLLGSTRFASCARVRSSSALPQRQFFSRESLLHETSWRAANSMKPPS
jgi:hypothetical protein